MSNIENKACAQNCPKYLMCERMINMGQKHLHDAATAPSYIDNLIEMEGPDGMVSLNEFFGIPAHATMTPDEREAHQRAGERLTKGGSELRRLLLEGCRGEGPLELDIGEFVCRSINQSSVDFTNSDFTK